MTQPYSARDRWFMWKAYRLSQWYGWKWQVYDRLGWQEKANKAFDKSLDWWESGRECYLGM